MKTTQPAACSLQALAEQHGQAVACAANQQLHLDDSAVAWIVLGREVDLFVAERNTMGETSRLNFLLSASPGQILIGCDPLDPTGAGDEILLARGLPGTRLAPVPIVELFGERVAKGAMADVTLAALHHWMASFCAGIAHSIMHPLATDLRAAPGQTLSCSPGQVISSATDVVWCTGLAFSGLFLGASRSGAATEPLADLPVPITRNSWWKLFAPSQLVAADSRQLLAAGILPQAVEQFQHVAVTACGINNRLRISDQVNQQRAEREHRRRSEARAQQLLTVAFDEGTQQPKSALHTALKAIGAEMDVQFTMPEDSTGQEHRKILESAQSAGARVRLNKLGDNWRRTGDQPMLGFLGEKRVPVALLWQRGKRYRYLDPTSAQLRPVTVKVAARICPEAYSFYHCFPSGPISFRHLWPLLPGGEKRTLWRLILTGLGSGLLTLSPAFAFYWLVTKILPTQSADLLQPLIVNLILIAAGAAIFTLTAGFTIARIEGFWTLNLDAALMDRLLKLPLRFFRGYRVGDLGARLSVMRNVRDALSSVAPGAIFHAACAVPMLAVLLIFDPLLSLVSMVLVLSAVAFYVVVGRQRLHAESGFQQARRATVTELFSYLSGIAKLRSTGSEAAAFAAWARCFQKEMRQCDQAFAKDDLAATLVRVSPLLALATLFLTVAWKEDFLPSPGAFLAVQTGVLLILTAISGLVGVVPNIVAAFASYQSVQPIFSCTTTADEPGDVDPGILTGALSVELVSYSYSDPGPLALDKVSMRAEPGDFIAIVGPSGSGKSSLLNLILGLDRPSAGAILFDGRDATKLNPYLLRRQFGVVTQDAELQPGSIFENIVGQGSDATLDDAWEAARIAGIEREIAALPMGMFTGVGEATYTFSGGQRQRLKLAAALTPRPRILLLDEATSWLDNHLQAEIMARLEKLPMTKLTVTQRLATVSRADRIYVLVDGKIVQQGNFAELCANPGPFQQLREDLQ